MGLYAEIKNNTVVNIIISDNDFATKFNLIEVDEKVKIGFFYDGENFYEKIQDYSTENKRYAMQLLSDSDWAVINDVIDISNVPHLKNYKDWINYRSQLRLIAINPPNEKIEKFPEMPIEIWE
jgi:hypothetical protein